jgi:hypothetical protein
MKFRVQYMGIILLVVIITVMFNPIGLPISVSKETRDFYDRLLKLKEGETVLWAFENAVIGAYTEKKTAMRAVAQTIAKQRANIVWVSFYPHTPTQLLEFIQYSGLEKPPFNYKYGENMVVMPYLAGEETAMAAIAASLKATYSTDIKGTPLANIPLLKKIDKITDFDLVLIQFGVFTFAEMFMRQWPAKYNIQVISMCTYSVIASYYGSYVIGDLDLVRGNAEFERLTGILGEEIVYMDIRNINCGITLALIAFGNIALYWSRVKKVPAEAKK